MNEGQWSSPKRQAPAQFLQGNHPLLVSGVASEDGQRGPRSNTRSCFHVDYSWVFSPTAQQFAKHISGRVIFGHFEKFKLFSVTLFIHTNWPCHSGKNRLFLFLNCGFDCCGLLLGYNFSGIPCRWGISAVPLLGQACICRGLPVLGLWAVGLPSGSRHWHWHPQLRMVFSVFPPTILGNGTVLKTSVFLHSGCLSTLMPGCKEVFIPFLSSSIGCYQWGLVIISLPAFSFPVLCNKMLAKGTVFI